MAGLFGWFLSGEIGLRIEGLKSRFGDLAIRATGGLALFIVVLMWWLSPLTPVGSGEVENREATDTGPAAVGNGIANTGSQTIEGPVTITGGGSPQPNPA